MSGSGFDAGPANDGLIAGRYRVVAELGAGGFGAVYRVEDLRAPGAPKALKTLKPNESVENLATRFHEEARTLASLRHPGLPRVYEFGEDEAAGLFYVLELIEGETLLARVESEKMDRDERFARAVEFFDTLDHVHRGGILHRDIKPENLMVPADGGHLRLIDFGIAKDLAADAVHTATGQILGTPQYLTPEQLNGRPYTTKSDLYQAGLVAYWLLTNGTYCFPTGVSLAQIMAQRMMGPRLDAIERLDWYERARVNLRPALSCLASNPDDRPGSAGIVRDALKQSREILSESPEARSGRVVIGSGARAPHVSRRSQPLRAAAQQTVAASLSIDTPRVASPWSGSRAGLAAGLVMILLLSARAARAPDPVGPSPSVAVAVPPTPSCDRARASLLAALSSAFGPDGRALDQKLVGLRPILKRTASVRSSYRTIIEGVVGRERLADIEDRLRSACPMVTSREGVSIIEHHALSSLASLEILDELATSMGDQPLFEHEVSRLVGPLFGIRELAPIQGDVVFGIQASAFRGPEDVEWVMKVPTLPDQDADLTFLGSGLDPKAIVDVRLNGIRLVFRNRSAIPLRDAYSVPETILPDGRASAAFHRFTPAGPVPRLVTLTRRIPRSALRVGDNRLRLRFLDLPGPLVMPRGSVWDPPSKLSSGTLWHAYVAFPAKGSR